MYHYTLGLTPRAPYRFRHGERLHIGRGVDHVPIIEIFLRNEYGDIDPGSIVVDLGANIGTFAIYAAMNAPNVQVLAYEPMPEFFQLLQRNVSLNGLDGSIQCINSAVAADGADRELIVAASGLYFPTLVPRESATAIQSVRVPCTDLVSILDSHHLPRIDLLKMDVEGAEYDILYGLSPDAFQRIRALRMEYHNLPGDRQNVADLKRFLGRHRYTITHEQIATPTHGTLWAEQHD
jgi:FkbM family methyltransferase